MKPKSIATAFVFLILLFSLLGCASTSGNTSNEQGGVTDKPSEITEPVDPKLILLQEEIRGNACPAGMAFLGYIDKDATENELRSFFKSSQYAEKYAFLADVPFIDAGGTELYAVVTAEKKCRAFVYRACPSGSGEYDIHTDDVLYEGHGMDCFLLRCNVSDIHTNAAILFKTGGTSFSVFPMCSGADGRLAAKGCYDFSIYAEDNHSPNSDEIIAYGLLLEASKVQYYIGLGMTLQYTGQTQIIDGRSCFIFAVGTKHDDMFVREYLFAVCDNLIYYYDALSDTWSILGAE